MPQISSRYRRIVGIHVDDLEQFSFVRWEKCKLCAAGNFAMMLT